LCCPSRCNVCRRADLKAYLCCDKDTDNLRGGFWRQWMWGTDVDHPENDYPESLREVIFILSTASSAVGTTREQLVTGPIAAPLSIYAIWRLGQLLCDLNVAGSPEAAVRHRDMIAAYVMLGIRCPSANDVQAANIEMTALRRWLDLLPYQFSDGGYPLCLSVSFRVSVGTGMLRDQHLVVPFCSKFCRRLCRMVRC